MWEQGLIFASIHAVVFGNVFVVIVIFDPIFGGVRIGVFAVKPVFAILVELVSEAVSAAGFLKTGDYVFDEVGGVTFLLCVERFSVFAEGDRRRSSGRSGTKEREGAGKGRRRGKSKFFGKGNGTLNNGTSIGKGNGSDAQGGEDSRKLGRRAELGEGGLAHAKAVRIHEKRGDAYLGRPGRTGEEDNALTGGTKVGRGKGSGGGERGGCCFFGHRFQV